MQSQVSLNVEEEGRTGQMEQCENSAARTQLPLLALKVERGAPEKECGGL